MSTRRLIGIATTGFALSAVLTASLVAGQQTTRPMAGHDMPMPAAMKSDRMMTKAQKIANAVQAGPSSVSARATVLDWPAKEGAAPEVLRAGTNGWTCFPDWPVSKGNDPLCVDETWVKWFEAYMAQKPPVVTKVGIGYMIAPGGGWASNTDPFAMKETMDNHWGHHQPHLMIVVPDAKSLAGISTDPKNGGPYVMFAGTPYAHIMAPITATPAKN
jgi:hypothetical protein